MTPERVTLFINNNSTSNIPVGLFANPDNMDNANATGKYSWNITGLVFTNNNVSFISLPYRPSNSVAFTTFTFNNPVTSLSQLLYILNNIGTSYFYTETVAGATFLKTDTDYYVYGDLVLTPATAYSFNYVADTNLSATTSVSIDFLAANLDATIDWGDGTTTNYTSIGIGQVIFNHTFSIITGVQFVTVNVTLYNALLTDIITIGALLNVVSVTGLSNFINVTTFSCKQNKLTVAPSFSSLMIDLDLSKNRLPVSQVNAILIALDNNGLSGGTVNLLTQSPVAPPSGAGLVAKNNLIFKGWTVTTD